MRRRTVLGGLAGLLLASAAAAAAPRHWMSLSRRLLPRRLGMVALDLPADAPPLAAVRLTVTGGDLRLRVVILRFADGRRRQYRAAQLLRRGEGSPPIAIAATERLVSVRVAFADYAGGRYLQLTGAPVG